MVSGRDGMIGFIAQATAKVKSPATTGRADALNQRTEKCAGNFEATT
jgi:hypothetical protein